MANQVDREYLLRHINKSRMRPSRILRYGIAILLAILFIVLKVKVDSINTVFDAYPFLLIFVGIILSAWYGGLGPGLVTTGISALAVVFIFVPITLQPPTSIFAIQVATFIVEGSLISLLSEISKQSDTALRRKSAYYEKLLVAQSDLGQGVILVEEGAIVFANEAFLKMLHYSIDELTSVKKLIDLIPSGQRLTILNNIEAQLADEPAQDIFETSILTKEGNQIEIELSIKVLKIGSQTNLTIMTKDITEQKISAENLRRSEEHYRLLVENISDYAIFTLKKNGVIASWNEAAERMIGYDEQEAIGQHLRILFSPENREKQYPELRLRVAESEGRAAGQNLYFKKDGSTFFGSGTTTPLWNQNGRLRGYVVVIQDITEQKKNEEKIRHQALHDSLTGLPNRALFMDRLQQAISLAERKDELFAVIFLDLDKFKNINDSLGHPIGDLLLKEVANRLSGAVRKEDTLARFGGDEFTLLLPQITSMNDCLKVVKKILKILRPTIILEGHDLHITTSMGISLYPLDGGDTETLLKNADIALYQAKGDGRNTYQHYNTTLNMDGGERLVLENDLRLALDRGEFILHYQPIKNLKTGEIAALEALIRWNHPRLGLMSPADFIPLAEETDIIIPLNEWVLKTACRQNKEWQNQGLKPVKIAVNISARQFSKKNLAEMVQKILQDTGLDPQWLELEVTESFAMQNMDITIKRLQELHDMGLNIAIDDFGIGHSSLNYLKLLPVNTLKIDRSFVQESLKGYKDAEIIQAMVALGHGLGLKIVAEGVETTEQLEYLTSLDCDYVQGFLFSKPVPAESVGEML